MTFTSLVLHAHSGLRWVVLISLIYAIFNAYSGKSSKRAFTEKDRKLALITFIASHIQLTIGLIQLFLSPKVSFSNMMANPLYRFFTMEHTLMMVVAIALITIGYIKSKKADDSTKKFSLQFNFYLIALVIILASIPWPFRESLGANWF